MSPEASLVIAGVVLFLGVYIRRRAGFGIGETISNDNVTLRSEKLGLMGRPDRIVRRGRKIIVEDMKSATRLYDSHRAQMGVYLLLVEEHYGQRPSHAVIVFKDGRRHKIKNTRALRSMVLKAVKRIKKARADLDRELRARPAPGKCRSCGQRENCKQRVG